MLTIDNIQLIPLEEKDTEVLFHAIDSNRDSLRQWLPFVDRTISVDDTAGFVAHTRQSGEKVFMINSLGIFCGLIGISLIDNENFKAMIGYWLVPAMEGKGLMTRSVSRLISYAFDELGLNRLLICVAEGNRKSRRVAERLGFKEEGIERDGELLLSGYVDIVRYGLLKREYNGSN